MTFPNAGAAVWPVAGRACSTEHRGFYNRGADLLDSDFGSIDIVPTISGTYEELVPRAVKMQTGRNSILVEAVSDLLATLTVPRRERDSDRVRQLRRIQCRQESAARHF